jgi:acyl carrier protein
MDTQDAVTLVAVKAVIVDVLGLEDRADELGAATPLLGSIPELDSMAVAELIVELERQFDIIVDDGDITAETFETLGSLAAFVDVKLR